MWQKQKMFVGVVYNRNESSMDDCHGAQGRSEISSCGQWDEKASTPFAAFHYVARPTAVTIGQRVPKLVASLGARNPELGDSEGALYCAGNRDRVPPPLPNHLRAGKVAEILGRSIAIAIPHLNTTDPLCSSFTYLQLVTLSTWQLTNYPILE
jgi:hypothetical protein